LNNRQIASLLCVLALTGNPGLSAAEVPKPKGGPIFTLPKTVVTLDMQVDKVVQTPGTYCEYIDLFLPGLEPAVACNANLLPPLQARTIDQLPGSVVNLDMDLLNKTAAERVDLLKAKRGVLKQKQKAAEEASARLTALGKAPSQPEAADKLEGSLKADLDNASKELDKREALRKEMQENRKKAKQEAKKAGEKLDAYMKRLDAEVGAAKRALDDASKKLLAKASEIAGLRKPLSEACLTVSLAACKDLEAAQKAVDLAGKEVDLAAEDARRFDRRRSHTVAVTKVKNFSVSTRGIPDPELVQDLPYASGFFKDSEQKFDLEPGGTLVGLKSTTTDHTAEFFLGILKAASGIVGRVFTGAVGNNKVPDDPQTDEQKFIAFLWSGAAGEGPVLDANFKLLPEGRRKQYAHGWAKLADVKSSLELAKRQYLTMAEVDNTYTTMLGGTSSQPGITFVLEANRKKFESLLSQGWTGASQVVSWTPAYEVTPAKRTDKIENRKDSNKLPDGEPLLLFKLASCGVDSAGAEILPVRVPQPGNMKCTPPEPEDELPEYKDITVAVARVSGKTVSSEASMLTNQATGNEGLPFMVPVDAVVKVANTGIRLVDPQVLISQDGFRTVLPVSLFNGSGGVEATYYQATGALKSITQKTTAKATGATVASVADAIMGPLDAKLKADAKAEAPPTASPQPQG
jgi:hypothetical protein